MTRLSTRRTSTRKGSRPSSPRSFTTLRKAAMLKRKSPAKKRAVKKTISKKAAQVPNFEKRIKSFLNNLNTTAKKRKKAYGAKDPIAKVLSSMHTEFSRHLKKANVVNQNFAKSLNEVKPRLNKLKNAPKLLKANAPKLMKYLRDNVRKNALQFVKTTQKTLNTIETDLNKMETRMKNEIKKSKNKKVQFRVDPSIKKKLSKANTFIKNAKKRWGKQLNGLTTHGSAPVKNAAKSLKKQFQSIEKSLTSTQKLIKRYAKTAKKKAGYTTKKLITPAQAKSCQKKWNKMQKELVSSKEKLGHFIDQIRAIKLF